MKKIEVTAMSLHWRAIVKDIFNKKAKVKTMIQACDVMLTVEDAKLSVLFKFSKEISVRYLERKFERKEINNLVCVYILAKCSHPSPDGYWLVDLAALEMGE